MYIEFDLSKNNIKYWLEFDIKRNVRCNAE